MTNVITVCYSLLAFGLLIDLSLQSGYIHDTCLVCLVRMREC